MHKNLIIIIILFLFIIAINTFLILKNSEEKILKVKKNDRSELIQEKSQVVKEEPSQEVIDVQSNEDINVNSDFNYVKTDVLSKSKQILNSKTTTSESNNIVSLDTPKSELEGSNVQALAEDIDMQETPLDYLDRQRQRARHDKLFAQMQPYFKLPYTYEQIMQKNEQLISKLPEKYQPLIRNIDKIKRKSRPEEKGSNPFPGRKIREIQAPTASRNLRQ